MSVRSYVELGLAIADERGRPTLRISPEEYGWVIEQVDTPAGPTDAWKFDFRCHLMQVFGGEVPDIQLIVDVTDWYTDGS